MAPTIIRFGPLDRRENLKLKQIPQRQPGAGEVLLKLLASGLSRAESMYYHSQYRESAQLRKAAEDWLWDEDIRSEEWRRILPRIQGWPMHDYRGEPPTEDPKTALKGLRPKNLDPEDVQAYAAWLIDWLEYCLPPGRQAQFDMLGEIRRKVHPSTTGRVRKAPVQAAYGWLSRR